MAILSPKFAKKKQKYMPKCSRYLSRLDRYVNLPNISISIGGFPVNCVSSRISQNIVFHMIGNKSFHFIF